MSLIDRRQNGKGKSAPNRKKFIDRYKRQIKDSLEKVIRDTDIKDVGKPVDVGINRNTTREPEYQYDSKTGRKTIIHSGNDRFSRGDTPQKPESGPGSGGGNSGDGEDDFTFMLTKEEFYNLYFEDMELPNFIKESLKGSSKFKLKRAGYTRDGVPTRLNSRKTMEMAIARRIAGKAQGKKKPLYLDDVDMRFDNIIKKPYPITKAVMFLIMDVSGSMEEKDKMLAKKFFILLYLFLTKCYDEVEVRFIRHTHEAEEVDEATFFYSRVSGGTIVSEAFVLMNRIIEEQINLEETNIYVAQASDGDNWFPDNQKLLRILEDKILPKVQYMTYIQTRYRDTDTLFDIYSHMSGNFSAKVVLTEKDVYPVLKELFERAK